MIEPNFDRMRTVLLRRGEPDYVPWRASTPCGRPRSRGAAIRSRSRTFLGLSLTCGLVGCNMGRTVKVFWVDILALLLELLAVALFRAITLVVLTLVFIS